MLVKGWAERLPFTPCEIFPNKGKTEAVILVDAANSFNNINGEVLFQNITILCPFVSSYVLNCYRIPASLFTVGGKELLSQEGTTQGDRLAIAIYSISTAPLLQMT